MACPTDDDEFNEWQGISESMVSDLSDLKQRLGIEFPDVRFPFFFFFPLLLTFSRPTV